MVNGLLSNPEEEQLKEESYSDKMRSGEIFVPFVKLQEHAANFLTNAALDPDSRIPEYKVCAVRLEKN